MNKRSMTEFKIKKGTAARGLTIEGFANKATEDRIGDLIPGKAWELDNFKKNPIIFFNHDRNVPIGKAITVDAGEEGLKMKVKLSKSNEAPIPFIRDMIKEGIVKSFSVGFDDHGTFEKDADSGLNVPERAELLETSVVTIPMHQDSGFDITKALSKKMGAWKTKSYHEAKIDVLNVKGAWVSAHVQDALEELAKDVNFDKDEALQELAMNSSITLQQLMDVVTGNVKDVSDEMLGILAESFSLDFDKLKEINERQSLEEEEKADDEEEEVEEEDEEEKADETKEDGDEEEEEEDEEEKGQTVQFEKGSHQESVAQTIPKFLEMGKLADEAVADAIGLVAVEKGEFEYSQEDYEVFFKMADCQKEEGDASNAVGLDASKENEVNFPNPQIDLQKAQLSMSGSAVVLLREIKAELQLLNTKAQGNTEAEGEEISIESSEESEESKALDRRKKMLDSFTSRLDKLG